MLSKVLIGLGVLVALAIAALVFGPRFVDWNRYKADIAAWVERSTGRELEIAGDISVDLLPTPTLSVERVRFSNLPGGSAPEMVTLEALKARVALRPLLGGDIRVERVRLVKPTILLETTADGRSNWDLAARPGDGQGEGPAQPGGGLDISLENVSIEDGTVVYRDARAGTERRVDRLDAEITAESLRGPFRASGSAVMAGTPLRFEVAASRLIEGRPAALGARLRLADADAGLRLSGTLQLQGAESRVQGRLEGHAADLGGLLAALAPKAAAGGSFAGEEAAFAGDLAASAEAADLTGLSIRLGGMTGSGTVRIVPGAPLKAKATLAINRLDLETLLAAAAAGPPDDGAAGAPPGFTLPGGVEADIDLTVAALTYRDGLINNLRLTARLDDGVLDLDRLAALLPGGSDIAVAGRLAPAEGVPRFAGTLEANSDNLRGLLEWFGVAFPAVPSDRLRKMSLVSRLTATPSTLEIVDLDLRLDSSRLRGGVVVALPRGPQRKPGFGIGLAVDQINLDAYLPPAPAPAPAAASAEGEAAPGPSPGLSPGRPLEALAPLAGLAANLDLRFGTLVYDRQAVKGVHVDGTIRNGDLTLRELSIQQFAGLAASLSGTIADLGGTPRLDAKFNVTAQDASGALRLAGVRGPAPGRLGALALGGALSGGADALAYDLTFALDGIGATGEAKGRADLASGVPRLETRFEIAAKDAGPLLGLAGLPEEAAGALGPLSLAGNAATEADGLRYDLTAAAEKIGGEGHLSGGLAELGAAPRIDARLELSAERPGPLLALAGRRAPTEPPGPVSLSARVQGTAESLAVSDLALQAGPTSLAGTVRLDRTGPRPRVTADLTGGEVALGWLAAAGGEAPPDDGTTAGGGAEAGPPGGAERWSEKPLDLSALGAVDAKVDLVADALLLGGLRIDQARLAMTLEQGVLDLESLTGMAYGGNLDMTGRLTGRDLPAVNAKLTASDVKVEQLVPDGALAGQLRGPLSIDADLRTTGLSPADLIGALQGDGRIEGSLTMLASTEQQAGAALLGLLGTRVEAARGLTDRLAALTAAFAGSPNKLDGSFRIENGVLRTEDTTLTGNGARAVAKGTADLAAWLLDMRAQVYRGDVADEPLLTVELAGPLDAPNVDLGGGGPEGGALGGLLQQVVPGLVPAPGAQGAPAEDGAAPTAPQPAPPSGFDALIPKILERLRQQ